MPHVSTLLARNHNSAANQTVKLLVNSNPRRGLAKVFASESERSSNRRIPCPANPRLKTHCPVQFQNIIGIRAHARKFTIEPPTKLYLIGDFLDDIRLRNKTMELLIEKFQTKASVPRGHLVGLIWDNTAPSSLLKKWILDVVVKYCSRRYLADDAATMPADFVLQVALRLLPDGPVQLDGSFMARKSDYLEAEEIV